jgi:hypothetical protein
MPSFEVSIAILNRIADSRLVPSTTAAPREKPARIAQVLAFLKGY